MRLCLVTNYVNGKYVNESLILNKLINTLELSPKDIFNFNNLNDAYKINKEYTHSLVLLDYKIASLPLYKEFLEEISIHKIFIVDTIPEKQKELHEIFCNKFLKEHINNFTSLSLQHQTQLYKKYADGFIFYNKHDKKLFETYYKNVPNKPTAVIPPSLGKKENIKLNLKNLKPNKLIGFNNSPSYSNGLLRLAETLLQLSDYSLDIYGSHGRTDIVNELLTNDITQPFNISFRGKIKNQDKFFNLYHIYYNASLYDSFNYFSFLSIMNGVVPIISQNSGTSSYFKNYPFIVTDDPNSLKYNIELINNTPVNYLKNILSTAIEGLKELNDENIKNQYYNFLNGF